MKRFLFIIICFGLLRFSSAQVGEAVKVPEKNYIGSVKTMGLLVAELFYQVFDEDTSYTLLFRNGEYQHIVDIETIQFYGGQSEVNALYKAITSVFEDENRSNKEYKLMMTVGKEDIRISGYNYFGYYAWVSNPSGYFMLNEKQLKKLFGKN